ncbi:MAG: hypothetical protein HY220_01790 [Candidatus Sungbacteria bacterium]|uniref:Uncharacterized protein n=1 Tax=Candidatus Sungiibacteriota bacterium TaxID=2750080 RepID=A0A9D6QYI6_9BACT|nr:hypothetical protein [Candidatus Sungbacteria bacterium]
MALEAVVGARVRSARVAHIENGELQLRFMDGDMEWGSWPRARLLNFPKSPEANGLLMTRDLAVTYGEDRRTIIRVNVLN